MKAYDIAPCSRNVKQTLHHVARGKNAANTGVSGMFAKDMNACDSAPCPETSNVLLHYYAMQRSKNAINTCVFGLCTKDMTACDSRSRFQKRQAVKHPFRIMSCKGQERCKCQCFWRRNGRYHPPAPQPPPTARPPKKQVSTQGPGVRATN